MAQTEAKNKLVIPKGGIVKIGGLATKLREDFVIEIDKARAKELCDFNIVMDLELDRTEVDL